MSVDVAIVGAGIVGAACADALSAAGLRVEVIDAGPVGAGATAAGMGHIVAMDDSEAQFALTRFSQQLWMGLAAELPREVEYEACGTLWVAVDDQEMSAVHAKREYYAGRGVAAEVLDARQVADAEPELRTGLAGGLLAPDDCVVYAPCAAQWLIDRAAGRGARLRIGARAAAVARDRVVMADGSVVSAGAVVVATGAAVLVPGLPVRPRKGHLAITDRYPGFVRHQLVDLGYLKSAHGHDNESVAFNVQPRATGQVLIGSSRQYGVEHRAIDHAMLARMLARAAEYMPRLASLNVIRAWTGFRAATPDGLPLVGPSDGGVFVATGHEGLGITTSLGTAHLIAAAITGRTPAIAAGPYLPARFGAAQ